MLKTNLTYRRPCILNIIAINLHLTALKESNVEFKQI